MKKPVFRMRWKRFMLLTIILIRDLYLLWMSGIVYLEKQKNDIESQKEYLNFLKDLFKDRTYVKVAYMTGILPIIFRGEKMV